MADNPVAPHPAEATPPTPRYCTPDQCEHPQGEKYCPSCNVGMVLTRLGYTKELKRVQDEFAALESRCASLEREAETRKALTEQDWQMIVAALGYVGNERIIDLYNGDQWDEVDIVKYNDIRDVAKALAEKLKALRSPAVHEGDTNGR